jgi:RimJ/RimL family protein N-acetyltransferase
LQELGAPKLSSVRSVGGGAKNKAWTQIRKNQLQLEMIEPEQTEAAYGSALLAQRGWENREQPVIETERLILRPFILDDAKTVQQLAGNHNVANTTLNIPHPYEDGMAEAWISSHYPSWVTDDLARYAITLKSTGKLMGAVGLVGIKGDTAGIGYWLGEPYWNKGYCTEANIALIDFCFNTLKLKRLEAEYLVTNPASGRVMEKSGMTFKGTRKIKHRDDSMVELNIYDILYRQQIVKQNS